MLNAQAIESEPKGPPHRRVASPASRRSRVLEQRTCPHVLRAGRRAGPSTPPDGRSTPRRSDYVRRATSSAPRLASASFAFFTQSRSVQPWIVTDARTFWGVVLEPFRRARFRHRLIAPLRGAHLLANLQSVAPVNEDRRFLRKYDRRSRGAFEAGQPGEPLSIASDIFAHMLVGERDDEAVELAGP